MKKVCAAAFVLMFVATTATTSFAARVKCEVKEIKDDGTVVLDCGDDAGKFIHLYLELGILDEDPFVSIEQSGIGQLMEMTVKGGHEGYKDIEIGVCGEQGGEPRSIDFCYRIGLDYVSCSPLRVPVARLAAAHAVINNGGRK